MAGDWIKMRNNLWDDPRVSQICDMTDISEAAVIGGLYWLWSAADEHTESGYMPGLSVSGIDRKSGVKGLGAGLVAVGWISDTEGGITINRFDEHNGASAKRRSSDAQRKANVRNVSAVDADKTKTVSGQNAPDCGAREEKNREEKRRTSSKAEAASGTRLPAAWTPDAEMLSFCQAERPDLQAEAIAHQFRDYWASLPGAKGRKADWHATWRNWVRNQKPSLQARSLQFKPVDIAAAQRAATEEGRRRLFGDIDEVVTIDA